MKSGTTLEDLEQASLDGLVNRIANKGVYFGLCAANDPYLRLEVLASEVESLCDFDLHEAAVRRGLAPRLTDSERADMRQSRREDLDKLIVDGRLCYRRTSSTEGVLTLTPLEWQKVFEESFRLSAEYETELDRRDMKESEIARGRQKHLTSKSGGHPIAMWFDKTPKDSR